MEIALFFILAYLFLRVSHLYASAWWIFSHGQTWLEDVKTTPGLSTDDTRAIDMSFHRNDGGKLPFLFFGVKSFRLRELIRRLIEHKHKILAVLLTMYRSLFWQYFTFPFIVAAFLISTSLFGKMGSELERVVLMLIAIVATLGVLAIYAEALICRLELHSWAAWYHRFPKKTASVGTGMNAAEFAFAGGSLIILTALALIPLNLVADTQFHAHQQSGHLIPIYRIGWAIREVLQFVFPVGSQVSSANWIGEAIGYITLACILAMAGVLGVWCTTLFKGGSSQPD